MKTWILLTFVLGNLILARVCDLIGPEVLVALALLNLLTCCGAMLYRETILMTFMTVPTVIACLLIGVVNDIPASAIGPFTGLMTGACVIGLLFGKRLQKYVKTDPLRTRLFLDRN